ncbi:hypothetical protein [Chitinophaga sp.]|uniref:hypothetical protein n=1 Tax=Chitinophaga sp. TaxID=1869181 RepID=UPI0031DECE9C
MNALGNFALPALEERGLTLGGNLIDNAELTLFRRGNIGAFSELEVPMILKDVKNAAERAGVGLKGVRLRVDRDISTKPN